MDRENPWFGKSHPEPPDWSLFHLRRRQRTTPDGKESQPISTAFFLLCLPQSTNTLNSLRPSTGKPPACRWHPAAGASSAAQSAAAPLRALPITKKGWGQRSRFDPRVVDPARCSPSEIDFSSMLSCPSTYGSLRVALEHRLHLLNTQTVNTCTHLR